MDQKTMPGNTGTSPPDALFASGLPFNVLFHGMPCPALMIEQRTNRIIDLNNAFVQQFQWHSDHILGQDAASFPLWGRPAQWRALLSELDRNNCLRNRSVSLLGRNGGLQRCRLSMDRVDCNGGQQLLISLLPLVPSDPAYSSEFSDNSAAQMMIDLSSRRILQVNPPFERLSGMSNSACQGRTVAELGLLPQSVSDRLHTRLANGDILQEEELRIRLPGGQSADVFLHAETVLLRNRHNLIVTILLSGQQQSRDRALRDSQERLRLALDAAQMGIWDWKLGSDTLHCSARAAELHGLAANDWQGSARAFMRQIISEDKRAIRRALVTICRGHQTHYRLTYRVPHGKSVRWLQATATLHLDSLGQPARIIGTVMDITDQRKSQTALVESEAKFSMLFQSAPDAYCLIHCDSQRIIEVNQSFSRTFGYPLLDLVGNTPQQAGLWSNQPADAGLNEAARGSEDLSERVCTFATRDGHVLLCETSTTCLRINRQRCVLFSFRDITARTQAEAALRASEDKFARAFKGSPDAITISERMSGRYLEVNEGFCRLTGYHEQDAVGRSAAELGLWVEPDQLDELILQMELHGGVYHQELGLRTRDAAERTVAVSAQPLKVEGQDCVLLTARDVTEQKRIEAKVKHLAYHDALTNLPNRLLLSDRLSQLNALYQRHALRGALLFFDLDHFKHINDSLGHSCGDAVLQEVTHRLLGRVRAEDTVARLGGDEFVVLLSGLNSTGTLLRQEVQQTARELLDAISEPMQVEGHALQLSASIGIALIPEHGDSAEDLLKRADIALYRVKEDGRDGIAFFEQSMQTVASERLAIESELRKAFGTDQFRLYYQPQVIYGSQKILGAEALLRWHHPRRGVIAPATFIDVLEQSSLIFDAGRWILNKACQCIAGLLADQLIDPETFCLSVNISPRQFRHSTFVDDVMGAIHQHAIPTRCLSLEITEGIVIENISDTIDKMNELRSHGVHFSIDDFGTGYSSLSYLKRLPVDLLKIDQSFVRDSTNNVNDAEIIRAIIAIASSLHMDLIAEGVETREQLNFLHAQGCNQFQGYLFSPPIDEHSFRTLLLTGGFEQQH